MRKVEILGTVGAIVSRLGWKVQHAGSNPGQVNLLNLGCACGKLYKSYSHHVIKLKTHQFLLKLIREIIIQTT